MIAAELFKFNDCVEGEIKAVFVVSFLPKCVTGLSSGSPIRSFNIPTTPPPPLENNTRHFNRKCQGSPALYTCLIQ